MLRKIKKAKLDYDTRYMEVIHDELDDDGNIDHISRDSEGKNRKVHIDIENSFKALVKHLIVRTEQFLMTEIEDDPSIMDKFLLTGFTIAGEGEHEGIVLIGQRLLDGGAVLNLVSRFTKLHPDHSDYIYRDTLDAELKVALPEIDLFITGAKMAPDDQLSLDFEDKPAKVKKERKSKKLKAEEESEEEEEHEPSKMKMAINH